MRGERLETPRRYIADQCIYGLYIVFGRRYRMSQIRKAMEDAMNKEILIVGGGPTGLLLAYELLRRQVPVRIIEKRQGPSHTTRAMTLHARTLEMLDHMGMAHRLEEVCLECPGNLYHFPGLSDDQCPRTDYRVLPTRYPFYYKISQENVELVLREHLFANYSLSPEYRTELVSLEQDTHESVKATIRHPDGNIEKASYPYVIGCDGVHSFVRNAAGIKFEGETVAVMSMVSRLLAVLSYGPELIVPNLFRWTWN